MDIDVVISDATSEVREGDNQKFVIYTIKENTGFRFNVLSGSEDGFFSYLGVQFSIHVPNGLFFDLEAVAWI